MSKTSTRIFNGYIKEIVDADTFDIEIDLGFNIKYDIRVRIDGYDAPETWRPSSKKEEILGEQATSYAKKLLLYKKVQVETNCEMGYYNRYLVNIYYNDLSNGDLISYKDVMIENGFTKDNIDNIILEKGD